MSYDDFSEHFFMLKDTARTLAYERALREVIRPGMTVLDFGCGTGILSFFAARAGASRVYAVDRSLMVHAAQALARQNELSAISFIHTDGGDFALPEKVDVIVSEWMGHFVLREHMLGALIRARDAHLRPGGIMLPRRIRWCCALMTDESTYRERAFFDNQPYELDFSLVRDWAFSHLESRTVQPQELSLSIVMNELDPLSASGEPETIRGDAVFDRTLTAFGVCGWFEAELSPSVTLDTSPWAPPTHWRQMVFPLTKPLVLPAGEPVRVTIRPLRSEGQQTRWYWAVASARETVSCDDFSYRAHLIGRK